MGSRSNATLFRGAAPTVPRDALQDGDDPRVPGRAPEASDAMGARDRRLAPADGRQIQSSALPAEPQTAGPISHVARAPRELAPITRVRARRVGGLRRGGIVVHRGAEVEELFPDHTLTAGIGFAPWTLTKAARSR